MSATSLGVTFLLPWLRAKLHRMKQMFFVCLELVSCQSRKQSTLIFWFFSLLLRLNQTFWKHYHFITPKCFHPCVNIVLTVMFSSTILNNLQIPYYLLGSYLNWHINLKKHAASSILTFFACERYSKHSLTLHEL